MCREEGLEFSVYTMGQYSRSEGEGLEVSVYTMGQYSGSEGCGEIYNLEDFYSLPQTLELFC